METEVTASQRKTIRRTRQLTRTCYIAIALINVALFTRRHPHITRAALTVVTIAAAAADLYTAHTFGVL